MASKKLYNDKLVKTCLNLGGLMPGTRLEPSVSRAHCNSVYDTETKAKS